MYAIVEIAGKQFKVQENDTLFVPYQKNASADDTLTFDRVLLVSNDDDVKVGAPLLDGATIKAKVLGHVKGDKVIVFKKKRRKRYKVLRGHRQRYTQVQVDALSVDGKKKRKTKKKETEAEAEA